MVEKMSLWVERIRVYLLYTVLSLMQISTSADHDINGSSYNQEQYASSTKNKVISGVHSMSLSKSCCVSWSVDDVTDNVDINIASELPETSQHTNTDRTTQENTIDKLWLPFHYHTSNDKNVVNRKSYPISANPMPSNDTYQNRMQNNDCTANVHRYDDVANAVNHSVSNTSLELVSDNNSYFDQNDNKETNNVYLITAEDCLTRTPGKTITGTAGTIYLMNFNENITHHPQAILATLSNRCMLHLTVPKEYTINITVEDLPHFSCHDVLIEVREKLPEWFNAYTNVRFCSHGMGNQIYTRSNEAQIWVLPRKQGKSGLPWMILHFVVTPVSLLYVLPVVYTSSKSGYIASYHSLLKPYALGMNASRDLILPPDHVIMISFPLQEVGPTSQDYSVFADSVTVIELPNGTVHRVPYKWERQVFTPRVLNSSIRVHFRPPWYVNLGIRMLFSFHLGHQTPSTLASGLFDCSVSHYAGFKQHVQCNLEPECQDGEDERDCLFHHPGCNGTVGYRNKCFTLIAWHEQLTWREAQSACQARGWDLANLKTPGERQAVSHIFTYGMRRFAYFIGAQKPNNLKKLQKHYLDVWIWTDQTVAYDFNISMHRFLFNPMFCASCIPHAWCMPAECDVKDNYIQQFICEFHNSPFRPKPVRLSKPTVNIPLGMTTCSAGHVTHDFLSCETDSHCGLNPLLTTCSVHGGTVVSTFLCDNGKNWIHYSLVCDFRRDCRDGSDETFCVHGSNCPDRTCRNSQCLRFDHWCDGMQHCVDNTDEMVCSESNSGTGGASLPPPVVIDLDGHGRVNYRPLSPPSSCPETHFQCLGDYVYCLPVYARCNGVYDCPDHEDEAGCQQYTCPGFYRCRASSFCVHPHHVCDGVFQCPQQDDEWMCSRNLTCPDGCLCQGLAFVCTRPFTGVADPDLRYLDASGSGIKTKELTENLYLMHLILSACNITELTEVSLPNLLHLDISDNLIKSLDVDVFLGLGNLRVLNVRKNPLLFLTSSDVRIRHESLHTVDLSESEMDKLDSKVLQNFLKLTTVNISYSTLHTIGTSGFNYLPNLVTLDLLGSPVNDFPKDVFRDLRILQFIRTDNHKLCCEQTLPRNFKASQCVSPVDEVSSCDDLLRADLYRASLWVFAALSLAGNGGCLIIKLWVQRTRAKSGFSVFVTNLSVADLIMGVYLLMIGVVDQVYRGDYLWHEARWKQSVACKTAGFLSLLSSEMSAFTICLITLDRFITLSFPFTVFRFTRSSAVIACCLAWTLGVFLAALPLLPVTSHWMFYSQTGICLPLPVTRKAYDGLRYSFGVMIVLNFALFLLVAVGQLSIYWSVHTTTIAASNTTRRSQELKIARRLISVAVSDFLCWFPICVVGLLANRGTPIPGEVSVGMAIFVLPLNSALNPFLYTFNMLMEKRRRAGKARILHLLETHPLTQGEVSLSATTLWTASVSCPAVTSEEPITSLEATSTAYAILSSTTPTVSMTTSPTITLVTP